MLPASSRAFSYSQVDSFVKKVSFPLSTVIEYDSLVQIFDKQFVAEDEKVRAVYFWVTENISYDGKGLYHGGAIYDKVGALRLKRCVCAGYADLLDHAFKKMNLEARYLTGSARLLDQFSQWNADSWKAGHAWNAVKVNNEWKLIDATWASGYLMGEQFFRERKDVWFFMSPALFLLSHLPDNSFFQLVSNRITEKEFYKQAFFLNDFEQTGIYSISHYGLVIGGEPGDKVMLWFASTKKMSHLNIGDRDGNVVKTLPLEEKEGKYYCRFMVGSVRKGSYFIGFMSMDERRRIEWEAEHVIGYFLDSNTRE